MASDWLATVMSADELKIPTEQGYCYVIFYRERFQDCSSGKGLTDGYGACFPSNLSFLFSNLNGSSMVMQLCCISLYVFAGKTAWYIYI